MDKAEAIRQARALLRGARQGSLATQHQGQPFVSLVTPAMAPDLAPLLWLSRLAIHTRQLQGDGRCALMVQEEGEFINPQRRPRVTVTGFAAPVPPDETVALKACWLALHPYAALYAGFADFSLWRLRPEAVMLVGGFAAAARLRASEVAPPPAAVAALAAAEAEIVAEFQADERLSSGLARRCPALPAGSWRLVAVDVDGADFIAGERGWRWTFPRPVDGPEMARQQLAELACSAG
ncbi:HugZ family pyridoxamine 5'-phosphate oxidase [Pseudoroseomonas sp. WGS1072]|uniref:HugZ family pyridoxamine 5'-phosphate oxidase n=1 Tax=Roseomonas sp. WGS1072 TaxID=3366816 RepID=UPI003BF453AB